MSKNMNVDQIIKLIKNKLEIKVAFTENIMTKMQIEEDDNILSGKTTIKIKDNKPEVIVTIFVSKNILKKKNIKQGIRLVLIHEFCHLVDLENPDLVMKKYFPEEFKIWRKAQDIKALKCEVKYHAS